MTEPLQSFSVPRNTDSSITIKVSSSIPADSLIGCTVHWEMYTQQYGIVFNETPILVKTNGSGVTIPPSPPTLMEFDVALGKTEIAGFDYGNYYYEATVLDQVNNQVCVISGIITLTVGEN